MDLLMLGDETTSTLGNMSPTSSSESAVSYIDMVGGGDHTDLDLDSFLLNDCWNEATTNQLTGTAAFSPDTGSNLFTDSGITSPTTSEIDSLPPHTHSPLSSTSSSSMSIGGYGTTTGLTESYSNNNNNSQPMMYQIDSNLPSSTSSYTMSDSVPSSSHMMMMTHELASPSVSNSSLSDSSPPPTQQSLDSSAYYDSSSHVINFNDLNENEQDTEELLNNIEHMLKSLQDNTDATLTSMPMTSQQQNGTKSSVAFTSGGNKIIIINNNNNMIARNNLIKQEPVDIVNSKVNKSKKASPPSSTGSIQMRPILPKDPNSQATTHHHNQPIHRQTLTVPTPESIKPTTGSTRNKMIKPLGGETLISPSPAVAIKPQALTVLAAIPAGGALNHTPLPIIIGAPTNSSPSTVVNKLDTSYSSSSSSSEYSNSSAKRVKSDDKTESCDTIVLANSHHPADVEVVKKQNRMIKNRESACLSRKRKKEYVTTLEDAVKCLTDKNDSLTKENQTLRERVASLEAENKVLRQQPQSVILNKMPLASSNIQIIKPKIAIAPSSSSSSVLKTQPVTNGLSSLITLKTTTTTTSTGGQQSLKRPFIMLAVFLVFGLNIFQFVSVNSPNSLELSNQLQAARLAAVASGDTSLEAALEAADARDNALVDTRALLARTNVKARHLLSAASSKEKESIGSGGVRVNRSSNDTMELVMINGTWHLLNLSMCYNMISSSSSWSPKQGKRGESSSENHHHGYYNHTDMVRMNSELNGWLARHRTSRFGASATAAAAATAPAPSKRPQNGPSSSSTLLRNLNRNRIGGENVVINEKKTPSTTDNDHDSSVYPISVYDNAQHSKRYENFVRSIRQRNDTFYFISFRRDYAILAPTLAQNKTQRPRISLLMPALLSSSSTSSQPINDSSSSSSSSTQPAGLTFMRIECEVTDTSLFHLKLNDIPLDYMKIIHQDFIMYGGGGAGGSNAGSGPQ